MFDPHFSPGNFTSYMITSVRQFLVISGRSNDTPADTFDELWIYNTISAIWKRYQPPVEFIRCFNYPIICSSNNKVYICCCKFNVNVLQHINFIVSFDVINTKWEIVYSYTHDKDDNMSPAIFIELLFIHNGSLYVMGIDEEEQINVMMFKFCLESKRWSSVQQFGERPDYNNNIYGTVFKNKLYIFEDDLDVTKKLREIKIFDLLTNVWTKRAIKSQNNQYPLDRDCETYAFSCNCAYMSGGRAPNDMFCSDIWKIDLETLECSQLDYSHETGICSHMISVVDDTYLYRVGGQSFSSPCINNVERFTLRLPSLLRLSLESICRSPNINSYIKSLPAPIVNEFKL
ncbi:Kelch domain-containing protein 10 [Thelohanellus kitauei]|uniref:Kelch domain-containing protein 10 n=1 Tax=Thelohanellus kitauei TaxID=669202 RepID=A0A0C2MQE4_THEKT|nr:Kelch domain-containing protein 10 [Thelohanellus kitauei]